MGIGCGCGTGSVIRVVVGWMNFLICAYDEGKNVHCDIFGKCLRASGWWPEDGIRDLVHEYDFALRLLRQSGR